MKVNSIVLAFIAFGARLPTVDAVNRSSRDNSNGNRILVKQPTKKPTKKPRGATGYQIWAADQSNSAPDQTALGVKGGFLWVFDSVDIGRQLAGGVDAKPLPCSPTATVGPCNVLEIFPQTLIDVNSGVTLGGLSGFGRLHGAMPSNDGRYINANMVSGVYLTPVGDWPFPASSWIGLFLRQAAPTPHFILSHKHLRSSHQKEAMLESSTLRPEKRWVSSE